jgi:protein SCO1/2
MPRRSILLFAGACVVIAAAIALTAVIAVKGRDTAGGAGAAGRSGEVVSAGMPEIGGPFQLVDQDGQAVDQTVLNGKWSLVFFGFTYCPDYCPTTLNALAATQARLGDKARDLQILFVTVDPERDTPQALKTYLSLDGYPDGVVGLTGSPAQVKAAADAYRVVYQKVGEGEDYTMNHTVTVYLMGPDGRFRVPLSHDLGPDQAARIIEQAMARG